MKSIDILLIYIIIYGISQFKNEKIYRFSLKFKGKLFFAIVL